MIMLSTAETLNNNYVDILHLLFSNIWAPILVIFIVAVGKFLFNDKLLYVKEIKRPTDSDVSHFIEFI